MTDNTDRLLRITAYLLLFGLAFLLMIIADQFLIPLTWAFIFSFVMFPMCRKLESRRVPRVVASILSTIVFIIVSSLVVAFLVYQSIHILKNGDLLHGWSMASLSEYLDTAQRSVGMNVVDSSEFFSPETFKKALSLLASRVNGISEDVVILTLIPMYLFFILNYRGLILRFVSEYFQGERLEHMQQALHRSYASIHEYLVGTAILTGVSALLTFLILFAFGVQYAFFFGVFLAILNLIPFIGNLLGFVVILLFVWGTKPPEYALYIGIALYVSNIVQENFLRPILVGNKMEMNAAVVFSAVIVGGMVWGFSGMVLFIPMVGVVKAFIDSNPDWKSFGIFFESK